MRHRAAHTLVELVVSMTVGSALMVLAVGLLHQSLSLASTARTAPINFAPWIAWLRISAKMCILRQAS